MIDKKLFQEKLEKLKQEGKYRVFNDIVRERGKFPNAIWYGKYNIKEIVNWCSNDYLGMGQHKVVLDAMHTALDQTGAGSGGTVRNSTRGGSTTSGSRAERAGVGGKRGSSKGSRGRGQSCQDSCNSNHPSRRRAAQARAKNTHNEEGNEDRRAKGP